MSEVAANQNICALCLETTVSVGGGVPLASPGCCGKWFHQKCLDKCMQKGNGLCPCCRAPFAVSRPETSPPEAQQQQQVQYPYMQQQQQMQMPIIQQRQRQPQQQNFQFRPPNMMQRVANVFSFGPSPSSVPDISLAGLSMEEEALPVAPAAISKPVDLAADDHNVLSTTDDENHVGISLTSSPEYETIGSGHYTAFHAIASISIKEDVKLFDSRKGMDVVCVLDKSGSMSGSKFTYLKHAMRFVQSQLSPHDRLSIITFNHSAQSVHGLMCMSADGKRRSEELLNNLSSGGGTSILSGMKSGYDILKNRRQVNTISCMFLLTDGVDDSDLAEKKQLASSMKADGTNMYVFAFGADHNSAHLNAIASAAESSYIYVENSDEVIDAFGGALGSQQGLAAKNITLKVTTPADSGIKLDEVNAGDYVVRIAAGSTSAEIKFANLFSGEKRDVLVRLLIPASESNALLPNPHFALFALNASYTPIGADAIELQTTPNENCLSIVHRIAGDAQVGERHQEVDVQLYRLKVTELLKQAMDMGDSNKVDEARKLLTDCVTDIETNSVSFKAGNAITAQLIDDLNTAINGMRNSQEYRERGGRSLMTEAYSSNVQQRCHMSKGGKKNAYQSPFSDAMQTTSVAYKSAHK